MAYTQFMNKMIKNGSEIKIEIKSKKVRTLTLFILESLKIED
jgi:hypothetical protein